VKNLAHSFARQGGRALAECKADYDGSCIEFAGDFQSAFGGRLVYFETPDHQIWRYHCAVEIDGLIHDLWSGVPVPKEEFARAIGATAWEYTT